MERLKTFHRFVCNVSITFASGLCACVHVTGVCSWLGHEERRATVICVGELCSMLKVLGEVRGSLSGDSITPH
jgi:hypothetical protein